MTYALPKAAPRDEAHLGQYLKWYERIRYTPTEKNGVASLITVSPDAEEFADVSFWQAGMDWDEYRTHARAVILRIGQNVWQDLEFEENYTEARRVELLIGGYFFFDGRASPQQQAEVIINAMQGKSFELELFIDWEHNYGGPYEGLPNVVKLMQLVEAEGVKCKAVGTYTGYYFFFENSNASANGAQYAYLRQRPLWIAWYASPSIVKVPAPWSDWTHWQLGTPTVNWGQPSAEIDMNKHNGTREQFTARYGGTVPQPPTGEPMPTYFRVTASVLNIRSSANGVDLGDFNLLQNDIVDAGVATSGWRPINRIWRGGQVLPFVHSPTGQYWASGAYMVATTFTPPAEPPVEPPAAELPAVLWIGTTRENVQEYRKAE
jgi:GH25 family lysozyme M1 (1,4-beta-N-acetylmuramidase)